MTYSCTSGYTLSRSATVSCMSSGFWSTRPTCTGMTRSHDQLWAICTHQIHELNPLSVIVRACINYLLYLAVTCDDLPTLTNGVIIYSTTSSPRPQGATATHNCNTGYELSGGTVNPRVCQSDRTWSGGRITCQLRKVLD